MKPLRRCFLSVAGLVASPFLFATAPHPTVLTVQYQDDFVPVVRVVDTDPVIMLKGEEKRLTTTPTYLAERAPEFSPENAVLILSGAVSSTEVKAGSESSSDEPQGAMGYGARYFETTLQARETLRGGFIVVTLVAKDSMKPGAKFYRPSLMVHALPDLPAGKTVRVNFGADASGGQAQVQPIVQIFDQNGQEVLTNQLKSAWEFYAFVEHAKQKHALEMYLAKFAHKNHAIMPLVMVRPVFPPGFTPAEKKVDAVMDVNVDGLVAAVTVEHVENELAREALHNALNGWLFLPQLKDGTPVPSRVKVPLQF
ncbi:MAG: hypothetical protein ACHQ4G_05950 [Opitutales bacterium]